MSGGALPTSPLPANAILHNAQPTRASRAHSGKRQARTRGAQWFGIKLTYPPMKRTELWPLYGFLLAQRGQADPFTVVLAAHTAALGTWSGAPVVNGAGQSGRTINMRGFAVSQAGVAKTGDLIKFNGHSKVYMVTADANSDAGGLAAVTIEPQPIAAIADGEAVISSNVPFTVARVADNMDLLIRPGVFYTLEIDLEEVW